MPDISSYVDVLTPRHWQSSEGEPPEEDLAEEFHEASKFHRTTMGRATNSRSLDKDPELRRTAAIGARELPHLLRVPLPPIDADREYRDHPVLLRNESCREFSPEPLPVDQLGRALWLGYGAYPRRPAAELPARRPVASPGALYPLELYLIADVTGAGHKGLYHYHIHSHVLEEVRGEVTGDRIRDLGTQPDLLASAPAIVLINGLFWRSRFKYKLRGYRFALLEAGAVIQQLSLIAQALGWGALPFAGLFDDQVEELCEIDGVEESFINAIVLGRPR